MNITLPYQPRDYQKPFLKAMKRGCKRACLVWHRRSGKEMTCFSWLLFAALERPGIYYYFFPSYKQGRRIIWNGMDRDGKRYIGHYLPKKLIDGMNGTEMRITLKNGSVIQILGLDTYSKDDIVGTELMGAIFSEYSIQDPDGWDYMRPVLTNSGGWAVFNFTPRGHNHAKVMYDRACESQATDGRWHSSLLTVGDTKAVSLELIDNERKDGMSEEKIQQEYYCSFNAGSPGNYYIDALNKARTDGRIGVFPSIEHLPIHTAWDIGINDPTCIWLFQKVGDNPRIIGYYEKKTKGGIPAHARYLHSLPFTYGQHLGPHDIAVTEQTGETRYDLALEHGIDFDIQPRPSKDEVIEQSTRLLSKCTFHEPDTIKGIQTLEAYEEDYDERLKIFKGKPKHNWASHGSDAFQTLTLGFDDVTNDIFGGPAHAPRVIKSRDIWTF